MNIEDRNRIRTGLSQVDLQERVPEEGGRNATEQETARLAVVRRARAARLGLRASDTVINFEDSQPTDSIVVGALICDQDEPIPEAALATGLRWPLSRVDEALEDLQRRLLLTGQRLARFDDGFVELRPAFEYLDERHAIRTFAASIKDVGLSRAQLAILYRYATYSGRGSYIDGKPDLLDPNVRILLEFGLLVEMGAKIEVANHVRYSLLDETAKLPYSPPGTALKT